MISSPSAKTVANWTGSLMTLCCRTRWNQAKLQTPKRPLREQIEANTLSRTKVEKLRKIIMVPPSAADTERGSWVCYPSHLLVSPPNMPMIRLMRWFVMVKGRIFASSVTSFVGDYFGVAAISEYLAIKDKPLDILCTFRWANLRRNECYTRAIIAVITGVESITPFPCVPLSADFFKFCFQHFLSVSWVYQYMDLSAIVTRRIDRDTFSSALLAMRSGLHVCIQVI